MLITVSFGVAGYSLPWGQVGYWACKFVTGVPDAIPIVGGLVVQVLRGGVSVGQSTLTRFYSAHTFVLPVVAVVLMLTHFVICLLYTSPSPRDATLSRMPSSA